MSVTPILILCTGKVWIQLCTLILKCFECGSQIMSQGSVGQTANSHKKTQTLRTYDLGVALQMNQLLMSSIVINSGCCMFHELTHILISRLQETGIHSDATKAIKRCLKTPEIIQWLPSSLMCHIFLTLTFIDRITFLGTELAGICSSTMLSTYNTWTNLLVFAPGLCDAFNMF